MKKPRFVPFTDNSTGAEYHNQYYSIRMPSTVKGCTILDTKTDTVYLVTTEAGLDSPGIVENGPNFVEETLKQHNWKL